MCGYKEISEGRVRVHLGEWKHHSFTHDTLSCPTGKKIKVLEASYGRHDSTTCVPSGMEEANTYCHSGKSQPVVELLCNDKPSCELYADNIVLDDPCPGTKKYLGVMYECV